jgi:hypothetical protein
LGETALQISEAKSITPPQESSILLQVPVMSYFPGWGSLILNVPPQALCLDEYLQACTERYTACLDCLEDTHNVPGVTATARFHHLKLDANGRPRWEDLAKNLGNHILYYCFSTRRRSEARNDVELMELRREARQFFRDKSRAGEAGEMLLYFLLEAVLRAPQVVAKISLKTNPSMETFGSDGIHMRWHEADGVLDLFFGEAKLYRNLGRAATEAVRSIEKFHEKGMEDFELRMVTRHFKHVDSPMKDSVLAYVNRGTATETVRINHACLLGYNWDGYEKLPEGRMEEMIATFRDRYRTRLEGIRSTVNRQFGHFSQQRLRFEIFILPFVSVDDFREAFLEAL